MRFGLSIPNLADPAELVELVEAADANGWDGAFLWEHVVGTPDFPVPMADPWIVLGAAARSTSRVRLGTTITALPRRQVQEVARQTVTLDRLSGGRATLGVGLGEPPSEYTALGRSAEPAHLADLLDESLEVLAGLWTAEPFTHEGEHLTLRDALFLPGPVQEPRIPVWTSCVRPAPRVLRRAARWDGVILARMGEAEVHHYPVEEVRRLVGEIEAQRPDNDQPYDVVVAAPAVPSPSEIEAYEDAGATWLLISDWLEPLHERAQHPPT